MAFIEETKRDVIVLAAEILDKSKQRMLIVLQNLDSKLCDFSRNQDLNFFVFPNSIDAVYFVRDVLMQVISFCERDGYFCRFGIDIGSVTEYVAPPIAERDYTGETIIRVAKLLSFTTENNSLAIHRSHMEDYGNYFFTNGISITKKNTIRSLGQDPIVVISITDCPVALSLQRKTSSFEPQPALASLAPIITRYTNSDAGSVTQARSPDKEKIISPALEKTVELPPVRPPCKKITFFGIPLLSQKIPDEVIKLSQAKIPTYNKVAPHPSKYHKTSVFKSASKGQPVCLPAINTGICPPK